MVVVEFYVAYSNSSRRGRRVVWEYIDAIEWVEMPNTRGMSQYADGGIIATKPYVSSGYINKMSNNCTQVPVQCEEIW
jgi:deoxyribodipyrimidine photolyase-like uncharacterized protein